MNAPSTALLSAILRPVLRPIPGLSLQTRAASTRNKLSLLDKLHRKQKQALRQEHLDSAHRAKTNPNLTARPLTPPTVETTPVTPSSSSIEVAPPPAPTPLPYTVSRAGPGQQLPVYHLSKGGGTKRLTRLRKLSGDLHALKDDLARALGVQDGYRNGKGEKVDVVNVNWQTKQVMVRGWRGAEVKAWAESRGF